MLESTEQSVEDFALGFSIFDENNPFSLINLVDSEKLKETFYRLRAESPKLLMATENEIEIDAKPTDLVARLRLSFWDEYERAIQTKSKLRLTNVVRAHCDRAYFYQAILTCNAWMIYIITPPRKYELTMRQILDKANKRLLEILDLPFTTSTGQLDGRVLSAIIRIQQMVDLRVKGAVTQRVQIQQHILNQNLSPEEEVYERLSLKELDVLQKKINANKEVKRMLKEAAEDAIEVESTDASESK